MASVLEALTEEECYLWAILQDYSGLDLAEFTWHDPDADAGCWRAWPFQWKWFRNNYHHQIDQAGRSVGKSLSIKIRGFVFPFLFPGQEMVITAPELVHLEPIVSLIETAFYDVRLGREMMLKGRSSVTHRPFQMNFLNGARLIGRIPQKDGRGVKGCHPIWLEMDEAQDYPEAGWVELVETLKRGFEGAVWRAHGVTRGVRDKFYEFTQDTPDNKWKIHRLTGMHRPNWTDDERQEKISLYVSKDNPDYRRNVLGLHGDATNPLFVLHQLMKCVDDDETSTYNSDEYFKVRITGEMLEDKYGSDDIEYYMNFPASHTANYDLFWVGEDVGYCASADTEIMTRRGWLTHDQVQVGDESLSINPKTGKSEWAKITDLYQEQFDSIPMAEMKGQSFDALVTPHHKWLVQNKGKWEWRQTRTLGVKDAIPLTVERSDFPQETYSDEFVELVGWFWTEGWWTSNSSAGIAQSERVNGPYVDRIRCVLKVLCGEPGPAYEVGSRKVKHQWTEDFHLDSGCVDFRFRGPLVEQLRSAVDQQKVPSVDFLNALSEHQLLLFIETSIDADGWRTSGHRKIEQKLESGIKSFEYACALAGLPTSTSYDEKRGRHHLSILKGKSSWPVRAAQLGTRTGMSIKKVDYSGVIWCPTLRHGNWLARRNGSVYFTGNTNHPSEILVFGEYRKPKAKHSTLRLLSRVHLARVNHRDQVRAMLHIIQHYHPRAFAMDRTGLGLPLFQDLQNRAGEIPALQAAVETIKGYNFSSKILVDFDSTIKLDPDFGDAVKDAGIQRNVLEYSTDRLRVLVDQLRLELPWDKDLIGEFQGQTFSYARGAMDQYGRKRFSMGKYHALDAARMAALAHAQHSIEEFTKKRESVPVLDQFI